MFSVFCPVKLVERFYACRVYTASSLWTYFLGSRFLIRKLKTLNQDEIFKKIEVGILSIEMAHSQNFTKMYFFACVLC